MFGLDEGDVADGAEKAVVVALIHPAQSCHFHRRNVWPGPLPPDDLGLVKAVDGLGKGIVITVADAAHGRHEIGFGLALGVGHSQTLHA